MALNKGGDEIQQETMRRKNKLKKKIKKLNSFFFLVIKQKLKKLKAL